MRLLVVYGSTEGHARKVAYHVAETAEAAGHKADVVNSAEVHSPQDPYWFGSMVVVASVHQGQHQTSVRDFVTRNKATLGMLPSAFFSVSLSAAVKDEAHQAEAQGYIDTFLGETHWRPRLSATVAGAVKHAEYDYFKRLVLTLLAGQLGPGVVTGEDVVYTDWDAVARLTKDFVHKAALSTSYGEQVWR